MVTRDELNEARDRVYAVRDLTGLDNVKVYAKMMVERIRDQLLDCDEQDLRRLQGKAEAYADIVSALEQNPYDMTNRT